MNNEIKLKKVKMLVDIELSNIRQESSCLQEDYVTGYLSDHDTYEAFLELRLTYLQDANDILTHKIDILKTLYNSISKEQKNE